MKNPKTMQEYFKQSSFTDAELNYIYNFMDTLQRMVKSLGIEYNAVWRTIFSDMRLFEEMMFKRFNMISNYSNSIEDSPEGVDSFSVPFIFNVNVNDNTMPDHVRNELFRYIWNLTDEEIATKISIPETEEDEPDEDILNVFQDNL